MIIHILGVHAQNFFLMGAHDPKILETTFLRIGP